MITVDNLTVDQAAKYRGMLPDERIAYLNELNGQVEDNSKEYENGSSEYGVRLTSFTLPKVKVSLGVFVGCVGSNGKVGFIKEAALRALVSGVADGTITTLTKTVKDGCATFTTANPALTFSFYETMFEDNVKRMAIGPKMFMPTLVTKGSTV
jgi:hypothetical protein